MCNDRFWKIENQKLTPPEPVMTSVVCEQCVDYVPQGVRVYESCMGNFCEDCLKEMSALDFINDILREKLYVAERE